MRGNRLGLFLLYYFIQTITCSRYFETISRFILRKVYVALVPASEFFFLQSKKIYYSLPFHASEVGGGAGSPRDILS